MGLVEERGRDTMRDEPRGDELHDDPRANDGGMDAVSPHYRPPTRVHSCRYDGTLTYDERCLICNPDITGEETKGAFEG
jgi:hypothetical protein